MTLKSYYCSCCKDINKFLLNNKLSTFLLAKTSHSINTSFAENLHEKRCFLGECRNLFLESREY